ncbi:MAG: hypothetical protein JNK46_05730 [Methylobacteriaceae bacterium]|nr:hypothetical protein [Methylobacteriaceae bacterium]
MNFLRGGAIALFLGLASQANAAPLFDWSARSPADGMFQNVQMVCDYNRCIDPRTGAYTQSSCNRGRCVPLGGIVGYDRSGAQGGYAGPRRGYDDRYERRRRWEEDRYYERPRREWRGPPSGYYREGPPPPGWRAPGW